MDQSQLLQLAHTNARKQADKSQRDLQALTNDPNAAKYEEVARPLGEVADLLHRIGGRLDALREPTKEPPP